MALLALRVGRLGEPLQWPQFRKLDVLSVDMFLYFLAIYFLPSGKFWKDKNQIRQILQGSQIRQFLGESPTGAPLQAVKFADWRLEVGGFGVERASRFWDTLL